MQLQFEVSSQGQTRVTWPQTLRPPADLPWVQRGRASGTPGSGPPKATLAAELWETPARATMKHPCGTAPQLCERACAIDDFDACTFDGRYALATKEYGRAVVVLDGACGRGEVEACVLLEWALSEKKGAKSRSRPDTVLRPWCEAGVARACAALDVPGWRRAIGPAKEACVEAPKACRPYAELLLAGPRLDADVTRALGALKQACGVSDERACGLFARTVIQLDKQDPVTVMPLLDRACAASDLPSCSLRAMNAGLGLTLPRSAQVANAWLEEACAKGALDACAQVLR
jgi:TPR repeat protein